MKADYYLNLARGGLRMPIGADLILREQADAEAVLEDGKRLGRVIEQTARRFGTPLAMSLMDLTLEKAELLRLLGINTAADEFHFDACPPDAHLELLKRRLGDPPGQRMQAALDAISHVATVRDLVPVGMSIGPLSLMTKLLADPITPLYLAGQGVRGDEDPEVRSAERIMDMTCLIVLRSVRAQIKAGARAICIAEPAASCAYFSPIQLEAGSDLFDRFVIQPNQEVRAAIAAGGADLMFHCCGELTELMLRKFCELRPAILSLGSSRKLWEDAAVVPQDIVLFGNLPTRKFASDQSITIERVREMTRDLIARMRAVGRAFILGSECDVLSVKGSEATIRAKVDAMLHEPAD